MSIQNNTLRRFAAGVGAAALAMAGTLALGTAASAAVGPGPDQPDAPKTGTLTINKYSGSPVGEGQTPNPDNLLDGVQFTVTQVGRLGENDVCSPINLTDAADWAGLTGTNGLFESAPAAPTAPFCLLTGEDYVHTGVTVDGQVTFNLDVGIYYVQETGDGGHPIVSPVPNFYVSIPTSLGEDVAGWNYDVIADPKNQLSEAPTKTVEGRPDGLILGADVTWNIEVPVPTLNNNEKFTSATVTDPLDSRLTFVPESSVVTVGDIELEEETHYTVAVDANNVVTWTFNAAGRAILDVNMGEDLTISFDTTVRAIGDGTIPNKDYTSKFNGTETPGPDTPYTYWGDLEILKTDDAETPLEGAAFAVYEKTGETCPADAPTTGAIATGVSGDDGIVVWNATDPASSPLGLWIANSDEPMTNPTKDYCVYETAVPAGHTLVPFNNTVTISAGESATVDLTVVNTRTEGPDLPLTGAQGTMIMTLGGLLLIGAGTGALVVSRRRSEA